MSEIDAGTKVMLGFIGACLLLLIMLCCLVLIIEIEKRYKKTRVYSFLYVYIQEPDETFSLGIQYLGIKKKRKENIAADIENGVLNRPAD